MLVQTRCKNCLLPIKAPGGNLNADGLCQLCQKKSGEDLLWTQEARQAREENFEQTIRDIRGRQPYDALVCLSGGKDSCYLLHKLKVEYKLNVLAYTVNMNVPDVAWDNIHRTIAKLDIDHMVFTPPREFYRKFFRYLLQNQEKGGAVRTVCYVCAPLFEGYAIQTAVEKKIPLVIAGYAPGQPEPERCLYEMPHDKIANLDWTPAILRNSELFSDDELARFWNPFRYPKGTLFPRYLAPFHAWPYNQDSIMKKVVELGLILNTKHASPVHSNCPVNWLLMYSDLKNLGYNPYNPEFSGLIRAGKADRAYWRIMMPLLNFMIRKKIFLGKNVTSTFEWLGLQPNDLKILRPETPVWPESVVVEKKKTV